MKTIAATRILQLSFWAKTHPVAARWLIAINRIVIGYIVFYWGALLADAGQYFSNTVFMVCAGVYATGFMLYPRRKKGESGISRFRKQKCCDALLVASSCLFWLGAGNYIPQWQPATVMPATPVEVLQSAIAKDKTALLPDVGRSTFLEKAKQKRDGIFKKAKTWKQQFFQKFKSRVKTKLAIIKSAFRKLSGGTVALLILASLAIVGAIGFLTIVISCNLSCNGQEGAASVVAVAGCLLAAGAVALLWTQAVKRNKLKEAQLKPEPEPAPAEPVEPATPRIVQVDNAGLRVCFEVQDPAGMEGVTIRLGDEVLKENIQLGAVPHCVDVKVKPGQPNNLSVSGGNGTVKMVIEDGNLKKSLTLPVAEGASSGVELRVKGK